MMLRISSKRIRRLDLKTEHHIGAVNSINWARIAAQVIYYFSAWLQATESEDEEVTFSVPSGNFGDVLAAGSPSRWGSLWLV